MNWSERPNVKKGVVGEDLVRAHLIQKGWMPYKPSADGRHPFDFLCASPDGTKIYVADAKAKPRREVYPDTGINISQFNTYQRVALDHAVEVYLYFVDEAVGWIYGGTLDHLSQTREISFKGRILVYPKREPPVVYFPLVAMESIAKLSEAAIAELKSFRRSSFVAAPPNQLKEIPLSALWWDRE